MKIPSGFWIATYAKTNLIALFVFLAFFTICYFTVDSEGKMPSILGGIVAALLVIIIQFLFSWKEQVEREKMAQLGLIKVIKHKRDRPYYGRLVKAAKNRIDLMGKTGSHFLEDFANNTGSHDEANALNEALRKPNMEVRFLLPDTTYLLDVALGDRQKAEAELNKLKDSFPNFSYRYFNHSEAHSIFVADDNVIIGPFFTGLSSMDSPALHVKADAHYAKKYLDYFEAEWDKAEPSK